LIAIDEAHCISKWGHDFRPAYERIAEFADRFPNSRKIALTATATPKVQANILEKLEFVNSQSIVDSFSRKNVSLYVKNSANKFQDCVDILKKNEGSALVYCKSRKSTLEITNFLKSAGISADFYHAGLSIADRNKKQTEWINNTIRVIVATNAFGMGIDKSNVRIVIHSHICENLESYYQEAGRAGRDGLHAKAIILKNETDTLLVKRNFDLKFPDLTKASKIYGLLASYFQVAVGIVMTIEKEFDLTHFCETYGQNPNECHHVLLFLQNQGLLSLSDSYFSSPRIQVLAQGNALSDFQERNPSTDAFIKTLLRMHGGDIFHNYVNFQERTLATACHISEKECIQKIQFLQSSGIIDYIPQFSKPLFRFLESRKNTEQIPWNYSEIQARKDFEFQATEKMIHYSELKLVCRMQFMQEYFGEKDTKPCHNCDICISNQRIKVGFESIEKYKDIVVQNSPLSMSNLKQLLLPELNEDEIKYLLSYWMENGEIGIDSFGLVYTK
ncbi:MAG: RecQ family ATP-dependent DNA helicase, partial [Leadbetterella sp.]